MGVRHHSSGIMAPVSIPDVPRVHAPALPVWTFTDTFRLSYRCTGLNGECGGGSLEFGGGSGETVARVKARAVETTATPMNDGAMEVATAVATAVRAAAW